MMMYTPPEPPYPVTEAESKRRAEEIKRELNTPFPILYRVIAIAIVLLIILVLIHVL